MDKRTIDAIFKIFAKDNPDPKTELIYSNHYTLLIAIVLSAQSTDISVNKATKELFEIADSPHKMLDLGEERLKSYIKTIGLYNSKAKNILKLSKILCEKYHEVVPDKREELEELPGVGRKTANVFLNTAFGANTIGVDTHVFRVSNRIGIAKASTPLMMEKMLERQISINWQKNAHHWLILHGRYVCKARRPLCAECKIYSFCEYNNKIIQVHPA